MLNPFGATDSPYSALPCPICTHPNVHIDRVSVHARAEDQDGEHISVNAISGHVRRDTITPSGVIVGEGRRHRIALIGVCEGGCEFTIVFTQHKGDTLVEILERAWIAP